jgi:hypothetical protein
MLTVVHACCNVGTIVVLLFKIARQFDGVSLFSMYFNECVKTHWAWRHTATMVLLILAQFVRGRWRCFVQTAAINYINRTHTYLSSARLPLVAAAGDKPRTGVYKLCSGGVVYTSAALWRIGFGVSAHHIGIS